LGDMPRNLNGDKKMTKDVLTRGLRGRASCIKIEEKKLRGSVQRGDYRLWDWWQMNRQVTRLSRKGGKS